MPLQLERPIYNISKSWADNLKEGPEFYESLPIIKHQETKTDFLGFSLNSPLGIPAGPLLSSQWIAFAASLGFDALTYKTIRSRAHSGHPLPNVVLVKEDPEDSERVIENLDASPFPINITNSFGMPSMPPAFLQDDIAKAVNSLPSGKLLIVSIVGTIGCSSDLTEDFIKTALLAKDAGAKVIEANFSCPNVASKEGSLYLDPENCYKIARELVKSIHPTPLIIKLGAYPDGELLKRTILALAKAKVRAVAGINSLSKKVIRTDGSALFGLSRQTSGICGDMIREEALCFVKEAHNIILQEKLDLELVGGGGIMDACHFDDFLQAGAKIATTATGMMWDPYLGLKWHASKAKHLLKSPSQS